MKIYANGIGLAICNFMKSSGALIRFISVSMSIFLTCVVQFAHGDCNGILAKLNVKRVGEYWETTPEGSQRLKSPDPEFFLKPSARLATLDEESRLKWNQLASGINSQLKDQIAGKLQIQHIIGGLNFADHPYFAFFRSLGFYSVADVKSVSIIEILDRLEAQTLSLVNSGELQAIHAILPGFLFSNSEGETTILRWGERIPPGYEYALKNGGNGLTETELFSLSLKTGFQIIQFDPATHWAAIHDNAHLVGFSRNRFYMEAIRRNIGTENRRYFTAVELFIDINRKKYVELMSASEFKPLLKCYDMNCAREVLSQIGNNAEQRLDYFYFKNQFKIILPLGGSVVGLNDGNVGVTPQNPAGINFWRVAPAAIQEESTATNNAAYIFVFFNRLTNKNLDPLLFDKDSQAHINDFVLEEPSLNSRTFWRYEPLIEMAANRFGQNSPEYLYSLRLFSGQ